MARQKPMAMRIGESVFCGGYLAFALVAAIIFLLGRMGAHPAFATECALATLLLGAGDSFHLIPRILNNLHGETDDWKEQKRRTYWLGLGNLISSITMTGFYILLFDALLYLPGAEEKARWGQEVVHTLLIVLAVLRVVLCAFPQNHWFSGEGNKRWGIIRNAPFVAMGIITVLYLLIWYQEWVMAALVTVSFVCYMLVVLYAHDRPAVGMLMIPKTICYIWLIVLLLQRL